MVEVVVTSEVVVVDVPVVVVVSSKHPHQPLSLVSIFDLKTRIAPKLTESCRFLSGSGSWKSK